MPFRERQAVQTSNQFGGFIGAAHRFPQPPHYLWPLARQAIAEAMRRAMELIAKYKH
jgi:hypothetical protein